MGMLIREWRREKGLSQEVLSGCAGIARSHLAYIENGDVTYGTLPASERGHHVVQAAKLEIVDGKLTVVSDGKKGKLYAATWEKDGKTVYVAVNLGKFSSLKPNATKVTLIGNPDDENNYEQHPVEPKTETVKLKAKQQIEVPAYTFQMYTIKL